MPTGAHLSLDEMILREAMKICANPTLKVVDRYDRLLLSEFRILEAYMKAVWMIILYLGGNPPSLDVVTDEIRFHIRTVLTGFRHAIDLGKHESIESSTRETVSS